jgi:hypothetical protein
MISCHKKEKTLALSLFCYSLLFGIDLGEISEIELILGLKMELL